MHLVYAFCQSQKGRGDRPTVALGDVPGNEADVPGPDSRMLSQGSCQIQFSNFQAQVFNSEQH